MLRGKSDCAQTLTLNESQKDKYSDQGYTSLPQPDESESGQMVLR